MEYEVRLSNLPAAIPYPVEDQREGWRAIKPGSFVIFSIDYELSMKKLLDPDVDDVMSSMPNKKYLALVADKSVERYGPIPVYQIEIFLVGRSTPEDGKRGLTGGECVPISPNKEHPELRSPVTPETSVPFPYSDCWIHTTTALQCRLAQTHISAPEIPIFTLPEKVISDLAMVKAIDQARAEDRVTILKLRGGVRDDMSSIKWEEELRTIRDHIELWPPDAIEKLTGGDAVFLRLFSDPTYAPQEPGGSRYVFICLNVWTDITQDVTLTNPEEFPDDIDQMVRLWNESNREWLDHYKTKFLRKPDHDRFDDWAQEVDRTAEKPPVESHLLYKDVSSQTDPVDSHLLYQNASAQTDPVDSHPLHQDVSTQTDPVVVYTDPGAQTASIITGDLTTKKSLQTQKLKKSLGAGGNQKRKKRGSSHGIVVRKSPGPIGARLPGREARAKSRVKTKAILQPRYVAHQAKPTQGRKPSGRVRMKKLLQENV